MTPPPPPRTNYLIRVKYPLFAYFNENSLRNKVNNLREILSYLSPDYLPKLNWKWFSFSGIQTSYIRNSSYNRFHNVLRLFNALPNFLSPQVKRRAIITYKHGIYKLPQELPNDLRLRKLGNIRKVSKLHRMIA